MLASSLTCHVRELGFARNVFGVRDGGALAIGSELPRVERALDRVALDLASVSDVGAEMGAERIEHRKLALFRAPDDQVVAEVLQRLDVSRLDLVGVSDLEPTVGDWRGEVAVVHSLKIERVSLFSSRNIASRSGRLHEDERSGILVVSIAISGAFVSIRKREPAAATSNRPARPDEAIGCVGAYIRRERSGQTRRDEKHPYRNLPVDGGFVSAGLGLIEPGSGGLRHRPRRARPALRDRDPVLATLQLEAQGCVRKGHGGFDVSLPVREATNTGGRVRKRRQREALILPAHRIGRCTAVVTREPDDPFVQ